MCWCGYGNFTNNITLGCTLIHSMSSFISWGRTSIGNCFMITKWSIANKNLLVLNYLPKVNAIKLAKWYKSRKRKKIQISVNFVSNCHTNSPTYSTLVFVLLLSLNYHVSFPTLSPTAGWISDMVMCQKKKRNIIPWWVNYLFRGPFVFFPQNLQPFVNNIIKHQRNFFDIHV